MLPARRCWSRTQFQLLDRLRWRTRVELANAIFEGRPEIHITDGDSVD